MNNPGQEPGASTTWEQLNGPKGGVLVLTRAAVEMLGEDFTHVRIGFNPNTRAVGLQPAAGAGQGCYGPVPASPWIQSSH